MSFRAVAVEWDGDAVDVCRGAFRNISHFADAQAFDVESLRDTLAQDQYAAVLVAGGSPCQDISFLHKHRQGLNADRTQLFQEIPRVATDCRKLLASLGRRTPVLQLLENVSHAPKTVVHAINEAMRGLPLTVHASSFGWVKRDRCFWGSDGQNSLTSSPKIKALSQMRLEQDKAGLMHAVWVGKKPVPEHVAFQDKFAPAFKPVANLGACVPKEAFATFTRAFVHPKSPDVRASPEACDRYQLDGRTYPAFAYEQQSLLWREQQWRQPNASERAALMCIPASMLQWLEKDSSSSPRETEHKRASLIGNSFHVPSVMLVLVLLFQLLPSTTGIAPPVYAGFEQCLRRQVRGTVFQPGMLESCPGLLSPEFVVQKVGAQFASLQVALPELVVTERVRLAVRRLQDTSSVPCRLHPQGIL